MAKKKKLSKREQWAKETGRPKEEYDGGGSSGGGGDDYSDMIKSILSNTQSQQPVAKDFDTEIYTPELEAEDFKQSEALMKPYFQEQIDKELEDLNLWTQVENVSYERSLRRARASMAIQGGAIGDERATTEGEMKADEDVKKKEKLMGVERSIGTANLTGGGYGSASSAPREGEIVSKMKTAIQEQQLWYKQQRANRYYNDVSNYYKEPTNTNLYGKKI